MKESRSLEDQSDDMPPTLETETDIMATEKDSGSFLINEYLLPIMNERYELPRRDSNVLWLRGRLKRRKELIYGAK